MNLTNSIALRYLFSKKSTNAINIITSIAMFGIAIGTAAIILIMSVFNGFQTIITGFLDGFNPDLKVVPIEGKYFSINQEEIYQLQQIEGLDVVSKALEEVVLFEYNDQQEAGTIKGVDPNYAQVTQIDTTIRQGKFQTEFEGIPMSVVGAGMALKLMINVNDPFSKLVAYSPNRKKKGLMSKDFKSLPISVSGVFQMQTDNDHQYVFAPYAYVEKLSDRYGKVTSLEINISDRADEVSVKERIAQLLGSKNIQVKNRFEQDQSHLRIMTIEKWLAFLIISLALAIVAFNLIGALWMIVLEKKRDISILRHLGMTSENIRNIFLKEGLLITGLGVFIGFALALLLYFLQVNFGIISMSDGFIVDAYPINLKGFDFIAVLLMVCTIGFIGSIGPAIKATTVTD